jgi:hypothetical protein
MLSMVLPFRQTQAAYFKQIGEVTVAFQTLEFYVRVGAVSFLGDDETIGLIATSGLSFRSLCQLLDALYRHRGCSADRLKKLADLLERARQAEEWRNAIMHSTWLISAEDTRDGRDVVRLNIKAKSGKGLTIQTEHIKPDQFRQLSNELWELVGALKALYDEGCAAGEGPFPPKLEF